MVHFLLQGYLNTMRGYHCYGYKVTKTPGESIIVLVTSYRVTKTPEEVLLFDNKVTKNLEIGNNVLKLLKHQESVSLFWYPVAKLPKRGDGWFYLI